MNHPLRSILLPTLTALAGLLFFFSLFFPEQYCRQLAGAIIHRYTGARLSMDRLRPSLLPPGLTITGVTLTDQRRRLALPVDRVRLFPLSPTSLGYTITACGGKISGTATFADDRLDAITAAFNNLSLAQCPDLTGRYLTGGLGRGRMTLRDPTARESRTGSITLDLINATTAATIGGQSLLLGRMTATASLRQNRLTITDLQLTSRSFSGTGGGDLVLQSALAASRCDLKLSLTVADKSVWRHLLPLDSGGRIMVHISGSMADPDVSYQ